MWERGSFDIIGTRLSSAYKMEVTVCRHTDILVFYVSRGRRGVAKGSGGGVSIASVHFIYMYVYIVGFQSHNLGSSCKI